MPHAAPTPGPLLLTPADHTLILIDFQPQRAFAIRSIGLAELRDNAARVAQAASEFGVSTIVTRLSEKRFAGPFLDELLDAFPGEDVIDRTTLNAWEDARISARVNAIGNCRLVMAGLWTSVGIVGPALSALDQDFEVHAITDACGDVSTEAHERAVERLVQAGVRPMTSLQYRMELRRDRTRAEGRARVAGGDPHGLDDTRRRLDGHDGR